MRCSVAPALHGVSAGPQFEPRALPEHDRALPIAIRCQATPPEPPLRAHRLPHLLGASAGGATLPRPLGRLWEPITPGPRRCSSGSPLATPVRAARRG